MHLTIDKKLQNAIRKHRAISVDIFDTALLRMIDTPRDVFHLVEHQARLLLEKPALEFYFSRISAETLARKHCMNRHGHREITLDDIYSNFESTPPLEKIAIDTCKKLEIEIEIALCRPNPMIHQALDLAWGWGKEIFFVSDMYLPKHIIREMLTSCGYRHEHQLFLSNEYKTSKREGGLFEIVCRETGFDASQILHIGDDRLSDVRKAKESGFSTHHYPRCREIAASMDKASKNSHPHSIARSLVRGLSNSKLYQNRPIDKKTLKTEFFSRFGYKAVGPLYTGFALWLAERFVSDKIESVYFLSRDGWIMQRTYDLLRESRPGLPPSHYLYASRKAFVIGSIKKLDEDALAFLTQESEPRSISEFLRRAGLDPAACLSQIARAGFSGPEQTVLANKDKPRIHRLLQSLEKNILQNSTEQGKLLRRYLRQTGLADKGRKAIVDIGWQASMQSRLHLLLDDMKSETEIRGYYLGSFAEACEQNHHGQAVNGWLCDFGRPLANRLAILSSVPILEFLHGAPHGSVKGYREQDRQVEAEFDTNIVHDQWQACDKMQKAALLFAHDFFKISSKYKDIHLDREEAFENIKRVLLEPNCMEAEALGNILHVDSFDDAALARPIAALPPTRKCLNPKRLRRSYLQSHWRIGWRKRAWCRLKGHR